MSVITEKSKYIYLDVKEATFKNHKKTFTNQH